MAKEYNAQDVADNVKLEGWSVCRHPMTGSVEWLPEEGGDDIAIYGTPDWEDSVGKVVWNVTDSDTLFEIFETEKTDLLQYKKDLLEIINKYFS